MFPSLFRMLLRRHGLILIGMLVLAVAGLLVTLAAGGAVAFLIGAGVAALAEVSTTPVETLGIGVLATTVLWVVSLLFQ